MIAVGLRTTNPIDRGTQLWRTEPIGNIVQKVETENPRKQYPDKEFLYVDISGIDNLRGVIKEWKTVRGKDAPSRARQKIRRDDVLVSTVRPNLNATALVSDFLDGQICSTGFCVLRSNGSVLPKYLYFYTRMSSFANLLSSRTRGASYPAVTDSDVKELEIPVPPIETQQQIVSLLERGHKLRQMREEANQLTNRVIQSVFLKMFGDPATSPMQWPIGTIGDIVTQTQYGLSKSLDDNPEHVTVIRMNNVTMDGRLDLTELRYVDIDKDEFEKYRLEKGDILFNRTNSRELVGKTGLFNDEGKCVFASYLVRVKVQRRTATPEYLWAFLNSTFGKATLLRKARGAVGQANINTQELRSIKIALAPVQLQERFSALVEKLRPLSQRQVQSMTEISELFHSLMRKAFTGQLVA